MISAVKVTYFDTAMVLIEVGSFRLLTDPVLDPPGTQFAYGPIVLRKTMPAAVTAAALGRIDAVLLSHDQHGDNLDNAGRALLDRVPLVLTTPLAATRLEGVRSEGLEPWASRTLMGADGAELTVTAVPAQHGPEGTQEATGPVTGFVLEHRASSAPIYVSGDTVPFAGTEEIARRYAPVGLAILNLGRVRLAPLGDATLSLSAEEAAAYAKALDARWVVPLHFEGWQHFTEDRVAATEVFERHSMGSRVRWLLPGASATFDL